MLDKTLDTINEIEKYINDTFLISHSLPSISMIGNYINKTKSHTHKILQQMVEMNILEETDEHKYQTKKIAKIDSDISHVPVVGTIACGAPILAEENIETYLTISSSLLPSGNYFCLRAKGDSMIKAGIYDGDFVIIRQQNQANEGDIVVALIDNEATLKRFFLDKGKKQVRLHPENDSMEDMFFDNIEIQGVAKKVIKDLDE